MTTHRLKAWLHAQLIAPLFVQHGVQGRSMRDRRGVALILALVFIVLLTVLVVEFGYETQVDASLAANSTGDLGAYLAAKSGIALGQEQLWQHLVEIQLGTQGSPPLDPGGTTQQQPMGTGEPYDGKFQDNIMEQINDATVHVTISDEYGKLNLNALLQIPQSGQQQVERQVLVETLRVFLNQRFNLGDNKSGAFDPTNAILDWLDYGDNDNERQDGAEDDYYMGLENPYHCKNGPMDTIEELLLIKGITPEIYFGNKDEGQLPLSEYLTVNGSWSGAINVNTAQSELLSAAEQGFNAPGSTHPVAPAEFENILARVESGETLYSMTELQGINKSTIKQQPPPNETPEQKRQRDEDQRRRNQNTPPPFVISSNCFRIHGDGMEGDALVRIEAFVWRNSPFLNANDIKASLPPPLAEQWQPPTENFRILDWKVIR